MYSDSFFCKYLYLLASDKGISARNSNLSSSNSSDTEEEFEDGSGALMKKPKTLADALENPGPYAKIPMEILAGAAAKYGYGRVDKAKKYPESNRL